MVVGGINLDELAITTAHVIVESCWPGTPQLRQRACPASEPHRIHFRYELKVFATVGGTKCQNYGPRVGAESVPTPAVAFGVFRCAHFPCGLLKPVRILHLELARHWAMPLGVH